MPNSYTATSSTGDLADALRGAIAAAHRGENSNFFTWTLREIEGSVGGFVNANDVTVTIDADVVAFSSPPVAQEKQCGNWYAWHDRMPGGPPTLHVTGTCVFPTGGFTVELRPASPQGINPAIYLMDLIITPPSGSATQVITTVEVHYREQTTAKYSHIHILPDNSLVPVVEVS